MNRVTSSVKTLGPVHSGGKYYVYETHTTSDLRVFTYEWLADGTLDENLVLEARADVINKELAAREAALQAVVGTEVPYTKHEFLSRFTSQERINIRAAAKADAIIDDFMEMLNASGGVYMTLARQGISYLQFNGILTPERAAEIGAN